MATEDISTQRAYTLKLTGSKSSKCALCEKSDCHCWRNDLWETHSAVNRGVKKFGDFLLTMRGGLSYTLANADLDQKNSKKKALQPTAVGQTLKIRRILLTLSWLSVEDEKGAPKDKDFEIVTPKRTQEARAKQTQEARAQKMEDALRAILKKQGASEGEIEDWVKDCETSISGNIRDDAVIVNRAAAFDDLTQRWPSLNREEAKREIDNFFVLSKMLSIDVGKDKKASAPSTSDDENVDLDSTGNDDNSGVSAEKTSSFDKDAPSDYAQKARQWVSSYYGTGKKNDFGSIANNLGLLLEIDYQKFLGKDDKALIETMAEKLGVWGQKDQPRHTYDLMKHHQCWEKAIEELVGWGKDKSKGKKFLNIIKRVIKSPKIQQEDLDVLKSLRKDEDIGSKGDSDTVSLNIRKLSEVDFDQLVGKEGHFLAEAIAEKLKIFNIKSPYDWVETLIDWKVVFHKSIGWGTGRPTAGRLALENIFNKKDLQQADLDRLKNKFAEEAGDKESNAVRSVPAWTKDLLKELEEDIQFAFVVGKDRINEYAMMLDHAARKVSVAHSWIKLAEQKRLEFEQGAKKLDELNSRAPEAVKWLRDFCDQRGKETHSIQGYRIRKGAIEGWDAIVKDWSKSTTAEERIAAVHKRQGDGSIEKFGDHRLFTDLAQEDARCVWKTEDGVDVSILQDYVKGTTAQHDQTRFKIPAYRHPDALSHPVFCDFGTARWNIDFACHRRINDGKNFKKTKTQEWMSDPKALKMGLWGGPARSFKDVELRWASKRLIKDLGMEDLFSEKNDDAQAINSPVSLDKIEFVKADRLGRAAVGGHTKQEGQPIKIKNVFDQKEWNGRLQVPRASLDRIARLESKAEKQKDEQKKHALQEQTEKQKRALPWFITFSPRFSPTEGPFHEYARKHELKPNRKGQYFLNSELNKNRGNMSKFMLARLPGLRVLSVDLGHRFAAACAVWETLSTSGFTKEIEKKYDEGFSLCAGGTDKGDLYCHIQNKTLANPDRKKAGTKIIYRRIGADVLPNGDENLASWARLDRQFLIKLQGEETSPRKSTEDEIQRFKSWAEKLGYLRFYPSADITQKPPRQIRQIDELMFESIAMVTKALARHGDRARIAYYLVNKEKPGMGGVKNTLNQEELIDSRCDALYLWYQLFNAAQWKDEWAKTEWEKRRLPAPVEIQPQNLNDDKAGQEVGYQNKNKKEIKDKLRPYAEKLAQQDLSAWAEAWANRWEQDNAIFQSQRGQVHVKERNKDKGILWELKSWIAPRGLRGNRQEQKNKSIFGIGGLSVRRITNVRSVYNLLKAFEMRPEPDDPHANVPEIGDSKLANFNKRLLDMYSQLREQRVKQLASRIIEGALGVGRVPSSRNEDPRPKEIVDQPCHAIVVENLEHYRPDELNTRRENRQLMEWSSAKVQKFLEDGCQLHGLHFREVSPKYTSRQCSRTGLPGIRCREVTLSSTDVTKPWWVNKVKEAENTKDSRMKPDEKEYIRKINELIQHHSSSPHNSKPLSFFIPQKGGDLFVAASFSENDASHKKITKITAIQADLNAAANIGLRAMMDPDWEGRWWFIPCKTNHDAASEVAKVVPEKEAIKGSAVFNDVAHLSVRAENKAREEDPQSHAKKRKTKKSTKDKKEITNFWRDPTGEPINSNNKTWLETPAYWNFVQHRVMEKMLMTLKKA